MAKSKPSKITTVGEINFDRLANVLAIVKSRQLGYEVTARITLIDDKKQGVKEA